MVVEQITEAKPNADALLLGSTQLSMLMYKLATTRPSAKPKRNENAVRCPQVLAWERKMVLEPSRTSPNIRTQMEFTQRMLHRNPLSSRPMNTVIPIKMKSLDAASADTWRSSENLTYKNNIMQLYYQLNIDAWTL